MLTEIRHKLEPFERCLVVSPFFELPMARARVPLGRTLTMLGLRQCHQFFGYLRKREDQRLTLDAASHIRVMDGFQDSGSYWNEGMTI